MSRNKSSASLEAKRIVTIRKGSHRKLIIINSKNQQTIPSRPVSVEKVVQPTIRRFQNSPAVTPLQNLIDTLGKKSLQKSASRDHLHTPAQMQQYTLFQAKPQSVSQVSLKPMQRSNYRRHICTPEKNRDVAVILNNSETKRAIRPFYQPAQQTDDSPSASTEYALGYSPQSKYVKGGD